jgi:heme/copper-type cytochrome/quinol oxidase subunit 4
MLQRSNFKNVIMKYIIGGILIIILGMLTVGFYLKNLGDANGQIIIGISVLAIAFVFMPLFIFYRYKNKNIKDFTFDKYRKDLEEHNKKEENKN